jgi:hypothetical protein
MVSIAAGRPSLFPPPPRVCNRSPSLPCRAAPRHSLHSPALGALCRAPSHFPLLALFLTLLDLDWGQITPYRSTLGPFAS